MKNIYQLVSVLFVLCLSQTLYAQCGYTVSCESCVSGANNNCSEDVDVLINLNTFPIALDEIDYSLNGTQFTLSSADFTVDAGAGTASFTLTGLSGSSNTISIDTLKQIGADTCFENGVSLNIDITIPVSQTISISENPTCDGSTIMVSSTGSAAFNYDWTMPDGSMPNGQSQMYTTSVTDNGSIFQVVVTDDNNCTVTVDSDVLTVNHIPDATIMVTGSSNICEGESVTLEVNTVVGGSYTWSTGSNMSSITVSPTSDMNYQVTVTANGCSDTDDHDITVTPEVTITTGSYGPVCDGDGMVPLSATPPGGTWSGMQVTDLGGGNGRFDPAGLPGMNEVTYTVDNGCIWEGSTDITVETTPVITNVMPVDATSCTVSDGIINFDVNLPPGTYNLTGNTGQGTVTISGGSGSITNLAPGPYNFGIENGMCNSAQETASISQPNPPMVDLTGTDEYCINDPTSQLTGNPLGGTFTGNGVNSLGVFDPQVAGVGTHTITYTFTDASNCTNFDELDIEVFAIPNVMLSSPQSTVCVNDSPFSLTGTPNNGTYNGSGVNSNGLFNPASAGVGSHTITYSFTNANNCTDTKSVMITVNPSPTVTISGNSDPMCENDSDRQLTGSPANGSWTGNGVNSSGLFDPSGLGGMNVTLTYTFTNASSCSDSDEITITVNNSPNVSASGPGDICENDMPVMLTGLPSGGTWTGNGVNSDGLFDPSTVSVGNVQVMYSMTNALGCSDAQTITINILAAPNVSLVSPNKICSNANPIQLSGSPSNGTFSGDGVNGTGLFNPASVGGASANIVYTFTNAAGCSDSESKSITINQAPVVGIDVFDNEACLDEAPFSIPGTPVGGVYTTAGMGLSNSGLFTPSTAGEGTLAFTYTFTDLKGCTNSSTGDVVVNPLPDSDIAIMDDSGIADDKTICAGDDIELAAEPTGIDYVWSGGQITNSITRRVNVSPTDRTTYRVTVTDNKGCTDTSSESIDVNGNPRSDFVIATSFDPVFFDQPFSLNNNSVVSPDASSNSYTWCFDPSNVVNLNGQSPNNVSLVDIEANNNNGTSSESIEITLKVVDDNLCEDVHESSINVVAMDCFAQTDFDQSKIYCKGEPIDINFNITVSTGAILITPIRARMTKGASSVDLVAETNTTNFRITDPSIINDPGEWIFRLTFSDNNSQLCNNVVQEYTVKIEDDVDVSFMDVSQINSCRGAGPILLPLDINFPSLRFTDNVEVSYDIVQGGMLLRQFSKQFNPQTTILSIDDSDLVDVQAGVFEVVLTSIQNSDVACPSQMVSSTKPIEFFDPIQLDISNIQCEPDSIFSFNVQISGGSGDYNIDNRIGVAQAVLVDPATNTYKYFCQLENYQVIVEDNMTNCVAEEINKTSLPPPGCDCDFVYKDVAAGDITINNGVLVDNVYRICSDEAFDITINNSQFTLASDSLVLYILNESVIVDSILSKSIQDIPTTIINGNTFQATIPALDPGTEYILYAGVVQKSRDNPGGLQSKDLTCTRFSTFSRILFYRDPSPSILLDETEFCANESNIILDGDNLIDSNEPGFVNSDLTWTVFDGGQAIGSSIPLANSASNVSFYLSGSTTNATYTLQLLESIDYRGVTCSSISERTITTTGEVAPDTASIIYWPGNILACTADTSAVTYRWGYIDHANGDTDVGNIGSDKFLFLEQNLDVINSTDRTYYVILRDRIDPDNRCSTVIYFSPTEALERDGTEGQNVFKVFPNPSDGRMTCRIIGVNNGLYHFNVFDTQGRMVQSFQKLKDEYINEIPITIDLPPGLYLLQSIGPDQASEVSKIMIH